MIDNADPIYAIKVSGYGWVSRIYMWKKGDETWTCISWVQGVKRLTKGEKLELISQVSLGLIPTPLPVILNDWNWCTRYATYYYKITGSYAIQHYETL